MSLSEERDQRLEKAKENTLVASNAQAIAENLQNLKAFPDTHRRRWIWELLQNAADASDAATAKNRVFIRVDSDKLIFSHSGAPFNSDEISHLIYHGSTKQEDESKKGKFGSGFLTLHLVSFKVRIRGVLEDNNVHESFEFFLDRSGETAREIQQNMDVAWAGFKNSLKGSNNSGDLTTTFECELNTAAVSVVESGLKDLAETVPYVLAFVDELAEVTVCTPSETKSWRRVKQTPIGSLTITDVFCTHSGETVQVAVIGNYVQSVGLAVLLRQSGESWDIVFEETTPRLFYPLPLVDIRVERTGVGSDFELETDFVENGREQILKVSRYLLEVKSTSATFVRMTLRQGEEPLSQRTTKTILCVLWMSPAGSSTSKS
jgi:hypothetical protein